MPTGPHLAPLSRKRIWVAADPVSSHRIDGPLDRPHTPLQFVRHIDDPPGPPHTHPRLVRHIDAPLGLPHTPRPVPRHIDVLGVLHSRSLVPRDGPGRSRTDSQLSLRHSRRGSQFSLCHHPIFDLFVNHELAKVRPLASRYSVGHSMVRSGCNNEWQLTNFLPLVHCQPSDSQTSYSTYGAVLHCLVIFRLRRR